MGCTTILVGKKASYDGSTMIARNDDSPAGKFTPKKFVVVRPQELPEVYRSEISKVEIPLPAGALRFTAVPNALKGEGIWAACGVNAANVGMTATETITSNPRVLGADPLVEGGIGEEDIVSVTLPFIRTAREGVGRLGALLQQYGTYEMNGIAFQDTDEIWWLETIGGHHWIARRVPDDVYAVIPNQLGLDSFDLEDAFGARENHLCSPDLREFIAQNHLGRPLGGKLSPREAFGSRDDSDHVYNTPRAWDMLRYFNPHTYRWYGENADFGPRSDDLPWCLAPEKKITPEDIKYVLSAHYQGTPFDPYAAGAAQGGAYRPIGVNRTDFMGLLQLRPDLPEETRAVEWLAFASNVFNAMAPFYANVEDTPAYLSGTGAHVDTGSFYWASRLLAAMADAAYSDAVYDVERYQLAVHSKARALLNRFDAAQAAEPNPDRRAALRAEGNAAVAELLKAETDTALDKVLYRLSCRMKNAFARSDA